MSDTCNSGTTRAASDRASLIVRVRTARQPCPCERDRSDRQRLQLTRNDLVHILLNMEDVAAFNARLRWV